MKLYKVLLLTAFLTFSIVPCFAHHMAVVVSKENATAEISSTHLAKMFRLEARKWSDGTNVVIVLHKNLTNEAQTLQRLNKMSLDELKSFISSHQESFLLVDSDSDVLHAVETMPGAVGLVDVRSIDGQVNVVKVDRKLPMEAGYLPH
jgi:ABC-type phosphate transport system substrate-binding protein